MTERLMLYLIIMPILAGVAIILFPRNTEKAKGPAAFIAAAANLAIAAIIFKNSAQFSMPWAGFGFEFSFRLYHFSAFIILATAVFSLLVTLYSIVFMREKAQIGRAHV